MHFQMGNTGFKLLNRYLKLKRWLLTLAFNSCVMLGAARARLARYYGAATTATLRLAPPSQVPDAACQSPAPHLSARPSKHRTRPITVLGITSPRQSERPGRCLRSRPPLPAPRGPALLQKQVEEMKSPWWREPGVGHGDKCVFFSVYIEGLHWQEIAELLFFLN